MADECSEAHETLPANRTSDRTTLLLAGKARSLLPRLHSTHASQHATSFQPGPTGGSGHRTQFLKPFRNARRLFKGLHGAFFLREKAPGIQSSVYTHSENAVADSSALCGGMPSSCPVPGAFRRTKGPAHLSRAFCFAFWPSRFADSH